MSDRKKAIEEAAFKLFFETYPHMEEAYYRANLTKSDTVVLLIKMAEWADAHPDISNENINLNIKARWILQFENMKLERQLAIAKEALKRIALDTEENTHFSDSIAECQFYIDIAKAALVKIEALDKVDK